MRGYTDQFGFFRPTVRLVSRPPQAHCSVSLSRQLMRVASERAELEDRSFSALVRRAIKKEIGFNMEEEAQPAA